MQYRTPLARLAGIFLVLTAFAFCLLGFEKLRAWGGVLVGEAEAKNLARLSGEPTAESQPG